MASTKEKLAELVRLSNDGDLGALLVRTFNGQIGRLNPRKDSDFMVGFPSKEKIPRAEAIATAVTVHYVGLGYQVEPSSMQSQDSFEALIFCESKDIGYQHVIITTFYPLVIGDSHNHLRATTEIWV